MILENFVLDVDGVLTDGTFYYSEKGKIMKKFGPHDSDGLKLIADLIKIEFIIKIIYIIIVNGLQIYYRR